MCGKLHMKWARLNSYQKKYAKFEGEQYFEVHSTQDTVEKCLDFIKHRYPSSLRPVIMRVTRTVETSVREIVDKFSSM